MQGEELMAEMKRDLVQHPLDRIPAIMSFAIEEVSRLTNELGRETKRGDDLAKLIRLLEKDVHASGRR